MYTSRSIVRRLEKVRYTGDKLAVQFIASNTIYYLLAFWKVYFVFNFYQVPGTFF